MTQAFTAKWLRADTRIAGLQPHQYRQVRHLCEKFFEKGRQYQRDRQGVLTSPDNQQLKGDDDGGCES